MLQKDDTHVFFDSRLTEAEDVACIVRAIVLVELEGLLMMGKEEGTKTGL
jgi:hypothetical protein